MKVVLYARVSLDERFEDHRYQDPENQLIPLRDWAKAMDWTIVKEYVDKRSGADPARPAFRNMLHEGMLRRFDTILVWKMDRFSRENMSNVVAYIQNLRARGIAVKSQTESWLDTSLSNPVGELILAVMTWAAAEERRKISERTKAGIAKLKSRGKWKGGRPRKKGGVIIEREKGTEENRPFNGMNSWFEKEPKKTLEEHQ